MAKRNGSTVAAEAPTALVGAGRRLRNPKLETQGAYSYKALADVRQKLAWDFFDLIGEVKQATYFLANTCSLVRLFPGQLAEDEQIPTVPPEGTPGLAEARMALDRLRSGAGGHGWLVRDVVLNFKTAGECYLVGTVEADMESRPGAAVNVPGQQNPAASPADMVERWEIASVSMLQSDGDWFTLQRSRKGRKAALPQDAYLLRLWQQHPRFTDDADSALMGVITELEELLVLSRSVRAAARSRFAGNGILYVADELELEIANPQGDDALDGEDDDPDLGEEIMKAASKAIADESDPSALVPIIVRGPLQMNGVSAKDALFHLKFGWDVDGKAHEARGELLGRLEVGLDIPVGSHSAGGKLNHWCVDERTQILTTRGWLTQDELRVGDVALTLDHQTGLSTWQPVRDVYRADVVAEPMQLMDGGTHSSLTTMGHRWPTVRTREQDGVPYEAREFTYTRDLDRPHAITTGAPCVDQPTEPKHADDLVELLAWFWTEGSVQRRRITIAQSHTVNAERVARIRHALTRLFGAASDKRWERSSEPAWRSSVQASGLGGPVTVFHLNQHASAVVLDLAPGKRVRTDVVRSMTPAQLALFVEVSCQADGQHYRRGTADIWQRKADALDAYELALILLGRMARTTEADGGTRVTGHRRPYVRPVYAAQVNQRQAGTGMDIRTIDYTGTVWCPVTENGTWLARREGTVYYTGNSAYQVDQSTWSRYGHPTMVTLVEALTSGYLRATMLEMGVAPEVVKSWVLWFDPAGAVVDPDKTTTITDAHDRLLISDEAGRTGLGFTEADAISDPEELARRVAIKSAGKVGPEGQPTASPAGGTQPNDGTPPENVTAAGRRLPLGRRLARIDAKLFDRLQVLSDAALFRILERAGSRARTAAHRASTLRNVVAAAPAHEVTRRLGPSVVASMGITDEELAAGALDGAEAQFMERVKAGQQAALDVAATDLDLTEDELRALQGRQEDDRHAAWLWFSAALTSLATSRLYSPAPTPAHGETQPDSAVPAGLIRQAMNLAGGGVASADQPATGVALGSLVLDTFAQHGQVVQSWVWDYGDGDRQRPFEPHMDLDGVAFNGWQDEALAVQSGDEWLGVGFYFPGDHMGCQCGVVADFGDIGAPAEANAE